MLEGGHDPDCRRCMPWEDLDTDTGRLRLEATRALVALRRTEPALQDSEIVFCPGPDRLVHYRRGNALEVWINAGQTPRPLPGGGSVLFAHRWDGELLAPGGALVRRL